MLYVVSSKLIVVLPDDLFLGAYEWGRALTLDAPLLGGRAQVLLLEVLLLARRAQPVEVVLAEQLRVLDEVLAVQGRSLAVLERLLVLVDLRQHGPQLQVQPRQVPQFLELA